MRIEVTIEAPTVRRPRRIVAALAIVLALVVPGVALASHVFADVPDSNDFHANITNLARAGVTAGCGGDNFCPSTVVTREQMAAFLNRGLGRATVADLSGAQISNVQGTTFSSFTITPGIPNGAIPGAAQVVQVNVSFTIQVTDPNGCPCTFRGEIRVDGQYANPRPADITSSAAAPYVSLAITGAALVTGPEPVLVEIQLFRIGGSGTSFAYGNATATTYPFTGNGTNVFGPCSACASSGADGTRNP